MIARWPKSVVCNGADRVFSGGLSCLKLTQTTPVTAPTSGLYRAVWRWHFYAGLIVLPFIILLAMTGGIYLFKDEINTKAYASLRVVEPLQSGFAALSLITTNALAYHGCTLKAYMAPAAPDRAAEVKILGSQWDSGPSGSPALWLVRKLHSLECIGWLDDAAGRSVAAGICGD